ncbi:MAG TPA: PH domain-containing protein [Actinoplanes sp.]|nr:PH domain-containing protein [Actinoplanes sp.]
MSEVAPSQPWRIKPVLPVTKGLAAVAVLVLVFAFGRHDPVQWVMAVATAIGLAGWALRDVMVPVRLAADPDGVTVVDGFARRRRLAWAEIERVRVDRRERLGLTTELLEVDADDALYLYSMHELGADPRDVLAVLEEFGAPHGEHAARHDTDAQESTDTAR